MEIRHPLKFGKNFKLCNVRQIDSLFSVGEADFAYPLRVVSCKAPRETPNTPAIQVVVSVSKRHFKRAVARNLLKRRIREALRLHQAEFPTFVGNETLHLAVIYTAKEILEYNVIENGIKKALGKLSLRYPTSNNGSVSGDGVDL